MERKIPQPMLNLACPSCGTNNQARVADIGKRGRCACGEVFAIESPAQVSVYVPTNRQRDHGVREDVTHRVEITGIPAVRQGILATSVKWVFLSWTAICWLVCAGRVVWVVTHFASPTLTDWIMTGIIGAIFTLFVWALLAVPLFVAWLVVRKS